MLILVMLLDPSDQVFTTLFDLRTDPLPENQCFIKFYFNF